MVRYGCVSMLPLSPTSSFCFFPLPQHKASVRPRILDCKIWLWNQAGDLFICLGFFFLECNAKVWRQKYAIRLSSKIYWFQWSLCQEVNKHYLAFIPRNFTTIMQAWNINGGILLPQASGTGTWISAFHNSGTGSSKYPNYVCSFPRLVAQ